MPRPTWAARWLTHAWRDLRDRRGAGRDCGEPGVVARGRGLARAWRDVRRRRGLMRAHIAPSDATRAHRVGAVWRDRASASRPAALVLALAVLASLLPASSSAATSTVTMSDNVFWSFDSWSSTVTVRAGDTVTWENRGPGYHNAVADDGTWRSANLRSGQSYSHTFDTPGTYTYTCTLHVAEQMFGTVVVLPAGAATLDKHVYVPLAIG